MRLQRATRLPPTPRRRRIASPAAAAAAPPPQRVSALRPSPRDRHIARKLKMMQKFVVSYAERTHMQPDDADVNVVIAVAGNSSNVECHIKLRGAERPLVFGVNDDLTCTLRTPLLSQ